ncbi:unnamed protein product [Amoebophrya sp. A25]|nr:unnamed protein product [Amoebophrya sp. A25]|eukprot:GSA25T00008440001.1
MATTTTTMIPSTPPTVSKNMDNLVEPARDDLIAGSNNVLILGEGNFSFAHAVSGIADASILERYFGFTPDTVLATSFDTEEELCEKYPEFVPMRTRIAERACQSSRANAGKRKKVAAVEKLQLDEERQKQVPRPRVTLQHGIDAVQLTEPENFDQDLFFNAVCWNHPHLGAEDCRLHRFLLAHFLHGAKRRLKNFPLESSVKGDHNYDIGTTIDVPPRVIVALVVGQGERWNIEEAAKKQGLRLLHKRPFWTDSFPNYVCKRNKSGKSFKNMETKKQWRPGQVTQDASMKSLVWTFVDAEIPEFSLDISGASACSTVKPTTAVLASLQGGNGVSGSSSTPVSNSTTPPRPVTTINTTFHCDDCDRSFRSAQGLKTHRRQVHELKKYAQDCASASSSSGSDLVPSTTSKNVSPGPFVRLTCSQCPPSAQGSAAPRRVFSSAHDLWQHRLSKHGFRGPPPGVDVVIKLESQCGDKAGEDSTSTTASGSVSPVTVSHSKEEETESKVLESLSSLMSSERPAALERMYLPGGDHLTRDVYDVILCADARHDAVEDPRKPQLQPDAQARTSTSSMAEVVTEQEQKPSASGSPEVIPKKASVPAFRPCPVCGQAVSTSWTMQDHISTLRPLLGMNLECSYKCGKTFIEHRARAQHELFCRLKNGGSCRGKKD